jgi:alkylhydroperoxidase family enzyme
MPFAFSGFYGKVAKLDRRLCLPADTVLLIRQQVARSNVCSYCIDANRWAAIKNLAANEAKFDALDEYRDSPLFTDAERAALDYVTEVTNDKDVAAETFAAVQHHYDEHQICEIVWIVASEHLYNINNIALNIGSDGYCKIPKATRVVERLPVAELGGR